MAFIKLIIIILLLIYVISALSGIFAFFRDIKKWHNAETKVEIIPSSERIENNGRNDNDYRGTGNGDNANRNTGNDNNGNNNDSNYNDDRDDWYW